MSPFSWTPSQKWDGDDGTWSTFDLRVGTPEQWVRVIPTTAGQASWIVMSGGCLSSSLSCGDSRGGLVNLNKSDTREELGLYDLGLELNLGHNESGVFGLDTLALGPSAAIGTQSLSSQLVIGMETNHFRLGMVGLNQQPTNLSDFSQSYPSLLTTLRTQEMIPSLSWAYTAGARYRSKGVFGSLTLGGYDTSRFTPNNHSFTLASDTQRDLVVGLNSIVSTSANGSSRTLLSSPILIYIDSTIPYIYLPIPVCEQFEQVFGLVWNATYNLYFVNETLHSQFMSSRPEFTFTIGNDKESHSTVQIVLPYASFDQTMTPPILRSRALYFPIRRAANDSQYTLGRTFLQEAYLVTNYEYNNFSVAQTRFDDNIEPQIVAIPPRSSSDHASEKSWGRATVIGVAIGVSVLLIMILIFLGFLFRKRQKKRNIPGTSASSNLQGTSTSKAPSELSTYELGNNSLPLPELHCTQRVELLGQRMSSGAGNVINELPDQSSTIAHELGDPRSMESSVQTALEPSELHANGVLGACNPSSITKGDRRSKRAKTVNARRRELMTATTKSSHLIPISRYNTRSTSPQRLGSSDVSQAA